MSTSFINHRPARKWQKITLDIAPEISEAVAAFLSQLTGSGVETIESKKTTIPKKETVIGYLAVDESLEKKRAVLRSFLANLNENFPGIPLPKEHLELVLEEDWGHNWKKHFKTFRASQRVIIKPSWETYTSVPGEEHTGEVVIEIDPGLAFGTGHHASTLLALRHIDSIYLKESPNHLRKVLDVGTGTGILSIACALFGAKEVLAIDNDPDAVIVAGENTAQNVLEAKISVSSRKIEDLKGSYDLIVANIVYDVLNEMAPVLTGLLGPGGILLLSGILKGEQEKSTKMKYVDLGLRHLKTDNLDEWVSLVFCN